MNVLSQHKTATTGRAVGGTLALLSLLLMPNIGTARCKSGNLTLRPVRGPQPTNLLVHLNGFARDVPLVRTIGARHPRLESEGHVIPLQVVKTYVGEQRVALAVLKPQENLRRGVDYVFAAEGISEGDLVTFYKGSPTRTTLRAEAAADHDPPVWLSPPRPQDSSYVPMGCGPASFARVAIEAKDAGPMFVKVELERSSSPDRVRYLLPVAHGVVKIGHGMCGGAFDLEPKEKARVHLTLVDLAGHETPAPGGPVHIVGPGPQPTPKKAP